MDISIKRGVDMSGIDPRIWAKAEAIGDVFRAHGVDPVITSAKRKPEGRFSFHHTGRALDWRGRQITDAKSRKALLHDLVSLLGEDFDVVMYDVGAGGHYHIEYDPR